MADVSWIKVVTGVFDDEKIKLILGGPEGDALVLMWFRLMAQAGKSNAGGWIHSGESIPYTTAELASLWNVKEAMVTLALQVFSSPKYRMIEWDPSSGKIYLLNWSKHQNEEAMATIKENSSNRMQVSRMRQDLGMKAGAYCLYCGKKASMIDFLIPLDEGGAYDAINAVDCCKHCAELRVGKDIVFFLNEMLEYGDLDVRKFIRNPKFTRIVKYNSVGKFFSFLDLENRIAPGSEQLFLEAAVTQEVTVTNNGYVTVTSHEDATLQATNLQRCATEKNKSESREDINHSHTHTGDSSPEHEKREEGGPPLPSSQKSNIPELLPNFDVLESLKRFEVEVKGGFVVVDRINSYRGVMDDALILQAIKVSYQKDTYYLKKVLEDWAANGYRKLLDHPEFKPVEVGSRARTNGTTRSGGKGTRRKAGSPVATTPGSGQTGRAPFKPRTR